MLQQRPRQIVIVTRKGMYAITAMIAVIGVVCVTALSYSFTDTGKVKISFRPIEEFGFKVKRGKVRRSNYAPTATTGSFFLGGGKDGKMSTPGDGSIVFTASDVEELCLNGTIVGIDAAKGDSNDGSLVGAILNGSLLEIVNGTVLVNGVKLNCTWFFVNGTAAGFENATSLSIETPVTNSEWSKDARRAFRNATLAPVLAAINHSVAGVVRIMKAGRALHISSSELKNGGSTMLHKTQRSTQQQTLQKQVVAL